MARQRPEQTRDPGASSEVEVIELDRADYDRAVQSALSELGLTYKQLETQARKGRFTSLRARKLWLAIGEPRGANC